MYKYIVILSLLLIGSTSSMACSDNIIGPVSCVNDVVELTVLHNAGQYYTNTLDIWQNKKKYDCVLINESDFVVELNGFILILGRQTWRCSKCINEISI